MLTTPKGKTTLWLCGKCVAVKYDAAHLEAVAMKRQKGLCDGCKSRRYVAKYQVTDK